MNPVDERLIEVWAEPLAETERRRIERALDRDNAAEIRHWLEHCLQILDAQNAKRAKVLVEKVADSLSDLGAVEKVV